MPGYHVSAHLRVSDTDYIDFPPGKMILGMRLAELSSKSGSFRDYTGVIGSILSYKMCKSTSIRGRNDESSHLEVNIHIPETKGTPQNPVHFHYIGSVVVGCEIIQVRFEVSYFRLAPGRECVDLESHYEIKIRSADEAELPSFNRICREIDVDPYHLIK